ncbi:MAG: ATP-binding protein [Polaromonas sp.]
MRALRCLLWVSLWLCASLAQAEAWQPGQSLTITQMEFVKSDATEPPTQGWQPQSLPDSWRVSRRGASGYGWYRIKLTLAEQPTSAIGLLISMVGTTYAVYVNGVEVGDGGGMTGNIQRNGSQPQYVSVAPQVFKPGDNWLHVRLRVASNLRGGMTPLLIGSRSEVEAQFDSAFFRRVTLSRSANVVLIVAGLIVGLLWLRRPAQVIYGYFAGLAVLWSLRNFHYTYSGGGIPSRLWEAFILGSLGVIGLLLLLFMLRLTQRALPRTERAAKWIFLSIPVLFLLLGEQVMSQLRLVWYGLCVAMLVSIIVILVQHLRQPAARREPGPWVILAALQLTLGLGLHDYAVSSNLLPYGSAAMMAFGAPVLLASLVFALASQYFIALEATEKLNATLEQKVRERTDVLQQTYDRMAELQRVAAVATERERLMRDIHDGVGSQLISAKVGIAQGDLSHGDAAGLIDQCIDDLRLVMDSLDPEQRHVADALATLRHRLQPKLAAVGIESNWHISQHPVPLGPGALLDVVRIVQEALTNVLKHARASLVDVRFEAGPEANGELWQLTIRDNGCGFTEPPEPAPGQGTQAKRGLTNMRRRAAKLGASLVLQSASPTGTVLVVRCPAA